MSIVRRFTSKIVPVQNRGILFLLLVHIYSLVYSFQRMNSSCRDWETYGRCIEWAYFRGGYSLYNWSIPLFFIMIMFLFRSESTNLSRQKQTFLRVSVPLFYIYVVMWPEIESVFWRYGSTSPFYDLIKVSGLVAIIIVSVTTSVEGNRLKGIRKPHKAYLPSRATDADVPNRIRNLAKLLAEEIITPEEYEKKKAELLRDL